MCETTPISLLSLSFLSCDGKVPPCSSFPSTSFLTEPRPPGGTWLTSSFWRESTTTVSTLARLFFLGR